MIIDRKWAKVFAVFHLNIDWAKVFAVHTLPLTVMLVRDLLPRGLQIGLTHQLALYDSVYIALAEKLNYPLITADERQERAASAEGITIKALTDFSPMA
ncbi:MAG TPA: type II toxin-antitoxin system VapC family toxin [Anaerolineales bacterium]